MNFVSPTPVTNADFTATLGRVLKRPAVLPVPKFALRLGVGSDMANEMLLGGARVRPFGASRAWVSLGAHYARARASFAPVAPSSISVISAGAAMRIGGPQ